jgi:hypothetical protein
MVILILFGIVKWLINLAKNPEEDKVADTSTYE